MWKQYCFRKENHDKIIRKLSGKRRDDSASIKSLYQSFSESSESNVSGGSDILTFVSLSALENTEIELGVPEATDDAGKEISVDTKGQINELRDLLNCIQNNNSDINVIINLIGDIFNSISPQQVKEVLEALDLQKLDEVAYYSHFCQLFLQVNPQIGFSVGIALVQQLLYLQIIVLEVPASRLLTITILEWTKIFPKLVLEGIIIPSIEENHLEKFQVDLIVRILKDGVPHNHVEIYLRECLQAITTVNERHFGILQTLIEKKVNFEEYWDGLLTKLLSVSGEHKKNMAFTKLVLVLLTKQHFQVQPHHFNILTQIVSRNETFLKKSAERALENLVVKHSIQT